jgi:hypothetical protein
LNLLGMSRAKSTGQTKSMGAVERLHLRAAVGTMHRHRAAERLRGACGALA